jgi:hypothetical protein
LGVSNSRVAVGYYEKNATSGCTTQAFEEYCEPSVTQCTPHFADFNPGGTNSAAFGISNEEVVVGSTTLSSGAEVGWKYHEFNYSTIDNTQIPNAVSVQVAGSEMQQREKTSFAITPRVKLALENLKLRLARAGR